MHDQIGQAAGVDLAQLVADADGAQLSGFQDVAPAGDVTGERAGDPAAVHDDGREGDVVLPDLVEPPRVQVAVVQALDLALVAAAVGQCGGDVDGSAGHDGSSWAPVGRGTGEWRDFSWFISTPTRFTAS